jgi:predicted ester cyclase
MMGAGCGRWGECRATEAFHPEFKNHYRPEGRSIPETDRPASGFQAFYGALLQGFPDATVEIDDQLAERDLVATRKTFRGTHLGELGDLPPTGNRAELEFIDIFRLRDGRPGRAVRCVSAAVRGVRSLGIEIRAGLQFEDRGSHELKGVPDQWRILAVVDG